MEGSALFVQRCDVESASAFEVRRDGIESYD